MDFLDKYKYHKDDPSEFDIDIKKFKKANNELDNNHLSYLLTNSVKIDKEIFPKVGEAIETVFNRIKIGQVYRDELISIIKNVSAVDCVDNWS